MSTIDRVRTDVAGVLGIGPRAIAKALSDLSTIADQMGRLEQLLDVLSSIDARVETLDEEVAKMRSGVESIDERVVKLNDIVQEELKQVTLAVHPLRRTSARLRRTGRTAKADGDAS